MAAGAFFWMTSTSGKPWPAGSAACWASTGVEATQATLTISIARLRPIVPVCIPSHSLETTPAVGLSSAATANGGPFSSQTRNVGVSGQEQRVIFPDLFQETVLESKVLRIRT